MSLSRFAEATARERLKIFETQLRHVTRHSRKAEPIHDLRVSIRRLTQALRVFQDLFDKGRTKKMRRKLGKLMDRCGEVRNCDIARETLKAANVATPQSIDKHLRKCGTRAGSRLAATLERWKSKKTIKPWRGWLQVDGGRKLNQDIPAHAREALRPLLRKFLEAGDIATRPEATPLQTHTFRLAGKRLRYSLEIFEAAAGSEWKEGIEAIQKIQEFLGAINDCATTLDLTADAGEGSEMRQSKIMVGRLLNHRLEEFRRFHRLESKNKTWWNGWIKPSQTTGNSA